MENVIKSAKTEGRNTGSRLSSLFLLYKESLFAVLKIFFRQFYCCLREQEECDQVRDRHQSVEGLCDTPDQSEV